MLHSHPDLGYVPPNDGRKWLALQSRADPRVGVLRQVSKHCGRGQLLVSLGPRFSIVGGEALVSRCRA